MPFEDLIKKFQKPGDPDYHNNMGTVHKDKGRLDDAVREYQKAIRLKPNDEMYHCNLASAWAMKGDHDKAFEEYRRALELNPDDYLTHFNFGNLYKKIGQEAEAIQEYQLAIKLQPDRAEAYYNLANCYWEQKKTQEAAECYEKALVNGPRYAHAMLAKLRLGVFCIDGGLWTKAEEYLTDAWAHDEDDFMVNYLLAVLYLKIQDDRMPEWAFPAKAVIHSTKALRARPDDIDALQIAQLAAIAFDKTKSSKQDPD
jgi:tetratricopeptide (TPR) repeat protein